MANNCDGTFADDCACMTACGGYDESGLAGDVEYGMVQCRIYHSGAPAAVPITRSPDTATPACSSSSVPLLTDVRPV